MLHVNLFEEEPVDVVNVSENLIAEQRELHNEI
jgi:hypothetical protein